jgi:hypothetical protein
MRYADEVTEEEPADQQGQTRQRHHDAASGDPVECQEQAREHQRRAHILLQEEEQQR